MRDPVIPIRPPEDSPPVALHDRAMDNLQFIRDTMARSAAFTAISGWGVILMGGIAVFAAVLTDAADPLQWTLAWLAAAVLAFSVSTLATFYKSRQVGEPLLTGPGRKFVMGMLPALIVGGVLTIAFLRTEQIGLLPGIWLLLYGTAVIGGGAFSVRTVPAMGICFLVLGSAAVVVPGLDPSLWMALGFGGLHLVFGAMIARRHGG